MITLHGYQNTRSTRALWALEEAGAQYQFVPVDLSRGEHRTPEFLALSPGGKVPVLVDDDVVITESAAICTYIGEKFPQSGLMPTDIKERAYYFKWCFFIMTELEAPLWAKAKHTRFLPEERRVPEVAATCDWEFHRALALVARHIRDQQTLVGNRFTAADIMLSGILNWARKAGTSLESLALEAYAERMSSRPALARALDAEQKAIMAKAKAQA